MKAIKLASVFAVSAVAAAVSTATFAAEPVVSGTAGIEYVSFGDSDTGSSLSGNSNGELNLVVDTGVVFAQLEFKTTNEDETNKKADEGTGLAIEKIYVTQGAVKFGRFDGSVSTGSFMGMDEIYGGVDLATTTDTDSTGVRYMVTPELTVALEATEASGDVDSDIGFAASYVMDFGGFKAGISGGSVGDANAVNVGVQTVAGPATLSLNYGTGASGATGDTDVSKMTGSVAFAATEALTLTLEYSQDLESDGEPSGTYFVGEYAAGDLVYYVKNYAGDLPVERTVVGVKANF